MAKNPLALLWAWIGPGDGDYARVGAVQDGDKYRVLTAGKTVVTPPAPPTGATPVNIGADDPLEVGPNPASHTTEHVIGNGKVFHLQSIVVGAEGDPTEAGSKVEVLYYDGATEHILERLYVTGFSQPFSYDDVNLTRGGLSMAGDGSTKKILVRRIRMSQSANEIDAVVRGYEQ